VLRRYCETLGDASSNDGFGMNGKVPVTVYSLEFMKLQADSEGQISILRSSQVRGFASGGGGDGMGGYLNVLMKSTRTFSSTFLGICHHMEHLLGAFPIHKLSEVSDLTTLDTCSDIVPIYGPVVDTLGFGLSHPSSPFSIKPI
jgi:hypothetical protein